MQAQNARTHAHAHATHAHATHGRAYKHGRTHAHTHVHARARTPARAQVGRSYPRISVSARALAFAHNAVSTHLPWNAFEMISSWLARWQRQLAQE